MNTAKNTQKGRCNTFKSLFLLILLALLFSGCGLDGPDVILDTEANERLNMALFAKTLEFPPSNAGSHLIIAALNQAVKNLPRPLGVGVYYLTESVDYCERAIVNIQARSLEDLYNQHLLVSKSVCKLERVKLLEFTQPFQGSFP